MSFIAEFAVELPMLREASKAVPEVELSGEDIVLEGDVPHKFVVCAAGPRLGEFEAALSEDPTVAEYSVLREFPERAYYIITYDRSTDLKGTYHAALERDIVYTDLRLRDGEYLVRAEVPDRDALVDFREHCLENDIPFRVERIYREDPTVDGAILTDAQREALTVAYERGYFDSPRETTLEAIADELGITRQAVADRLRRGHRRLIEAMVV